MEISSSSSSSIITSSTKRFPDIEIEVSCGGDRQPGCVMNEGIHQGIGAVVLLSPDGSRFGDVASTSSAVFLAFDSIEDSVESANSNSHMTGSSSNAGDVVSHTQLPNCFSPTHSIDVPPFHDYVSSIDDAGCSLSSMDQKQISSTGINSFYESQSGPPASRQQPVLSKCSVCRFCTKVMDGNDSASAKHEARHFRTKQTSVTMTVARRMANDPMCSTTKSAVPRSGFLEGSIIICAQCSKTFAALGTLRAHYTANHQTVKDRLACIKCHTIFANVTSLQQHRKMTHSSSSKQQRTKIIGDFEDNDEPFDVDPDESIEPDGSKFYCYKCKVKLGSAASMLEHANAAHLDSFSIINGTRICADCGVICPNERELNQHLNQAHGTKLFSCDYCSKQFRSYGGFSNHLELHRTSVPNECPFCTYSSKTVRNLYLHVRMRHIELYEEIQKSSNCTEEESNDPLDQMDDYEQERTNLKTKKRKEHSCSICFTKFAFQCHLDEHFNKIHLQQRRFPCPYCSYAAQENQALKNHIRAVHLNEKRFSCDKCSAVFATSSVLARHRRTHTGDFLHKCQVANCGMKFNEKRLLEAHVNRIHEKRRPFLCTICGKSFLRKDYLTKHTRTKHSEYLDPVS